jgi:manganese/zinc/iron transport system substrate-binding protein
MSVISRSKKHQRLYLAVGFLLATVSFSGCGGVEGEAPVEGSPSNSEPLVYSGEYPIRTVCTTGMVADLVKNVGGEHVTIEQLMEEGVDPHLYKASPGDGMMLNRADLVFYSGLHLEGKMGEIFVQQARRKPTYPVTETLESETPERLLQVEDDFYDPHIWFDVELWSECVTQVSQVLAEFDPVHEEEYNQRAAAYVKELQALHLETKTQIATIPKEKRVLVTAHDAFEYFGRAYDIEVKAIQGVSTETETGLKRINELVDFLVEQKIDSIFVETSVNERNMHSLIEGCAARDHTVTIGGELFSDAMGKAGTPEGTYQGMIRHNVKTIVEALK